MIDSDNESRVYQISDESLSINLSLDVGLVSFDQFVSLCLVSKPEQSLVFSESAEFEDQSYPIESVIVLHKYSVEIYQVYKDLYAGAEHIVTKKIKQVNLKIQAVDLVTSGTFELIGVLGRNGEMLLLNLYGKFLGTLKHPNKTDLNEHNRDVASSSFLSDGEDNGDYRIKSVYAFTSVCFGKSHAFVGTKSGEVLVYELSDFSLVCSVTNLGKFKGEVSSVDKLCTTHDDEILVYFLSDGAKGVLQFKKSSAKILAKTR